MRPMRGRYGCRFCRHRLALASLAVLVLICGSAVLAPVIAPYDPEAIVGPFGAPPGGEFLLGTDQIGRDMLSRLLYAARTSLFAGVLATLDRYCSGRVSGPSGWIFRGLGGYPDYAFYGYGYVISLYSSGFSGSRYFKPGLWSIILRSGVCRLAGNCQTGAGKRAQLKRDEFCKEQ